MLLSGSCGGAAGGAARGNDDDDDAWGPYNQCNYIMAIYSINNYKIGINIYATRQGVEGEGGGG